MSHGRLRLAIAVAAILALPALALNIHAAELTVTPERAPASGVLEISAALPDAPAPARCDVVVTDAYRGTELLRSSHALNLTSSSASSSSAPSASATTTASSHTLTTRLAYAAEPGVYAVWLERAPGQRLAGPAHFFVPGVTKRGAWWLFDGQPMCGAIRTWGGVAGQAERLVQPLYKGGYGFNVLTLEMYEKWLGKGEAKRLKEDWSVLERNGAYAFVLPGELGWEGLTGAFAAEPKWNQKNEPSKEGGFWSAPNRAAVADYLGRLKDGQFPSGAVSPAFLGLCAFENHHGFGPWYDYSPPTLAAYRDAMRQKYNTIENYNDKWGTDWKSWAALDAPRDPKSTRRDWIPWTDFRFGAIAAFYGWLQPELRRAFPGASLFPIVGGMLATHQNDDWVTGIQAFSANDEREIARVVDALGTEGWADYVAGHSDLLLAATDPALSGVPSKPIWPDYYTYLSIGPDIAKSLILKRVDEIAHGATGTFMEHVGTVYKMGEKEPAFLRHLDEAAAVNRFLSENANLFIGSSVQNDVALVTPVDTFKYGRDKEMVRDADNTNAGIAHALTRLHHGKRWIYQDAFTAETGARFPATLATLGALASDRFLHEAERYVRAGGRLYLEGLGNYNEYYEPAPGRLDALIGARVQPLDRPADDEITFAPGEGRAARKAAPLKLQARRLARVTSLSSGTTVLATFKDGSPAVLERKVGDGVIVWAPNWIVRDASFAYIRAITQKRETPFEFWAAFDPAYCGYYSAILQRFEVGSRVSVSGPNPDAVRTSVLRTPAGSLLLSVVNYGAAKDLTLRLQGPGAHLRDLRTGQPIPFTRHGNSIEFHYAAPANGWTFFALAESAPALDAEIKKPLYHIKEVSGSIK